MQIHLIINPASGAKSTETVLKEEVLPLIQCNGSHTIHEHRTESAGDGIRIGRELAKSSSSSNSNNSLVMVLLGGDGTTHEVLNGIVKDKEGKSEILCDIRMALVPTGTANALYASLYPGVKTDEKANRLKSLEALLSHQPSGYPLALTRIETEGAETSSTLAHLITSHALHASILADSEELRSSHPGIERFKIAAAQNVTKWTNAKIILEGLGTDETVQRYDPESSAFKDIPPRECNIQGPILYFVCVTTDRLEPTFVPAPFSGPSTKKKELQRPKDAVDIVLIRPLRDPNLKDHLSEEDSFWVDEKSQAIREKYAEQHVQDIFGGMYSEGKHIDLRYSEGGPYICEYFRCAGYEWTPLESKAKRTCVDGTVFEADKIRVRVLSQDEGAGRVVVCM